MGRMSYHHYGNADPYRAYIREFSKGKGIRTAQTEMDPNDVNDLYADLTLGGVSYWETSYSFSNILRANAGHTTYTPAGSYFPLRQVLHYVRPGACGSGPLRAILVCASWRSPGMANKPWSFGTTPAGRHSKST